jgi:hypothetical protein
VTLPIVYPRTTETDLVILGLDPGGADGEENGHVGVALGCRNFYNTASAAQAPTYALQAPGWRIYETAELTPDEFIHWFVANVEGIDMIFGEMFTLEKKRALAQAGSRMPTSQLIGFVRMYCLTVAQHVEVTWHSNMVLKGPTAEILREKGIKPVSPRGADAARGSTGDHQRSAELHWWHGLMRANLVDGVDI